MLVNMKKGEKARIENISAIDALVQRRLQDMGFTVGTEICVKCVMPFGGPVMIEACGQCVGIRQKEAKKIAVERF